MITYEDLNSAHRHRGKKKLQEFWFKRYRWYYCLDRDEFKTSCDRITVCRNGDYLVKADSIVDGVANLAATRMIYLSTGLYLYRKYGQRYNALRTRQEWITGDFRMDKNQQIFNKRPFTKNVTDKVYQRKINKYVERLKLTAPFMETKYVSIWYAKKHLEDMQITPESVYIYREHGPKHIKRTLKKTRRIRWTPT